MKIGLTDDEKICREILLDVLTTGAPQRGGTCLDWLVSMDILRPPERDDK